MSPVLIGLSLVTALLVLLPTRRLYLAGWSRDRLTLYFAVVWVLAIFVAMIPGPARFLVPFLLIAYLAPFVTLRDGIDRLLGRSAPPPGRVDDHPPKGPMKDVTPRSDPPR